MEVQAVRYIFRGKLCGYICQECEEPLTNVSVRLYSVASERDVTALAAAAAKDTFSLVSDGDVAEKGSLLIAEASTDAEGSFVIDLPESYAGGPFEIDVLCAAAPRARTSRHGQPVQFTITTLQPGWREMEDSAVAVWEHCLDYRYWCAVLARLGVWTICGHLRDCEARVPIEGATVKAFDADWTQDDPLGSAVTDADGHFLITYTVEDFKRTPFPLVHIELIGGPDVYFSAEVGGTAVLQENRSVGRTPGRGNIGPCFCVELCGVEPLTCALTGPAGCVHGSTTILPGFELEPITGTSEGAGFDHYELDLLYEGTTLIPGAIIYADAAGNPDPSLTQGQHQVSNGTLGFVDLQKAALGAGLGILTSTSFEVDLHTFGAGAAHRDCSITFSIISARTYIKTIGGAIANDVTDPAEPLRTGAGALATVGGSISIRGAAVAYGCTNEEIASYQLWAIEDPDFTQPQPANGSAFTGAGWISIASVSYTTADQRTYNTLDGLPDPDFLTNNAWFTRVVCSYVDFLPPICFVVPSLQNFYWPSPASGKYSVLLQVTDTAGDTYYDIQRVWIDNEVIRGKIASVAYDGTGATIPPCTDVLIGGGGTTPRKLDISGFATDPLIVTADLTAPTSDNFANYVVSFRRQGAIGTPVIVSSPTPSPSRAIWTGGAGDPPVSELGVWDLSWIDAGSPPAVDANGNPIDPSQRLARGTSCTYDIFLTVNDSTIVSESTDHNVGLLTFPLKIVNDLP